MPVIGFLSSTYGGRLGAPRGGIPAGLDGSGYVEGQNVAIEYRWADDQLDRLPALAADLVRRQVAVIVANSRGGAWRPRLRPRRSRSCSSRRRSGQNRPRRQPQPAGRQRHRRDSSPRSIWRPSSWSCCTSWFPRPPSHRRVAESRISPNSSPSMRDVEAAARAIGLQDPDRESRKRTRVRCRLRNDRPSRRRRAARRRRSVLPQPTSATRRAGGAPCVACNLRVCASMSRPAA